MPKMIFINLPVTDLGRSVAFYEALGGRKEPKFSNDQAAMIVLSDVIHVMLLTHDFWKTFTTKDIPDSKRSAQLMLAISQGSRDAVDAIVDAAAKAGGTPDCNPKQDHGFMYGRSFEDPDGHIWEPNWMDPAVLEGGPENMPAELAG